MFNGFIRKEVSFVLKHIGLSRCLAYIFMARRQSVLYIPDSVFIDPIFVLMLAGMVSGALNVFGVKWIKG